VAYDIWKGATPQAALMAVYFILAVWGWFKWAPARGITTEGAEDTERN